MLSESMSQSLMEKHFFSNENDQQKLNWILSLPHFHHHEKSSVTKNVSSVSLTRLGGNAGSTTAHLSHRGKTEA